DDELLAQAKEVRPKLIVCGGSAYPRVVEADKFREIADEVGALLMTDMAHFAGLVAAGLHPNPVPHSHFVTSTTHKTLAGPRAGFVLCTEEYAQALDRALFPGMQGGPLEHTIAAKATCFKIAATDAFRDYQRHVRANADVLAAGLVDGGFDVLTGRTDTAAACQSWKSGGPNRGDGPRRASQSRAAARSPDRHRDVSPAGERADPAPDLRGDEGHGARGDRGRDAARVDDRAPDPREE